jgi:hypothetical protein
MLLPSGAPEFVLLNFCISGTCKSQIISGQFLHALKAEFAIVKVNINIEEMLLKN